jgi:UDP:flavonoid glycosyltransferase YjiC (YdhE family)
MKRLLFMAETVTLAHLARPLAFLSRLSPQEWEIHLACADNEYRCFLGKVPYTIHTIQSQSPRQFRQALEWGRMIYTRRRLEEYITEDLALIQKIKPDVVYGDFRLSLSISARAAGVTYINIANAKWRSSSKIEQGEVLLLNQVKQKVAAHKAMMIMLMSM